MARSRHRLTKAITLKTIKPTLAWAQGAAYAFDFPANAARWTNARINYLLQSQTFDDASWVKSGSTVSADAITAPDGTLTADKLEENNGTSTHTISQTLTWLAGTYTQSVYVKAAERGFALLAMQATTHAISVNLTTGAASLATGSPTNITSTDAGNGWWRISFSGICTAISSTVLIYSSTDGVWANRSFTGTTGSGVYVWGAQLEYAGTVSDYIQTTSATVNNPEARYYALASVPGWTFSRASTGYALNNAGQLVAFASGAPRITDRGFLAEGSRQNKCTNYNAVPQDAVALTTAAAFNSAVANMTATAAGAGTTTFGVVSDTAALAAAGLSGAVTNGLVYCIDNTLGTGQARIEFGGTTGNTNTHIMSAYVRGGTGDLIDSGGGGLAAFAASTDYVRRTNTAYTPGGTTRQMRIRADTGQVVYFILNVFEEGAFVSSPIAVAGASATRAADSLTITGVTGLDYPASVFAEWMRTGGTDAASFFRVLQIDAGSATDRTAFVHRHTSNILLITTDAGGVAQSSVNGGTATLEVFGKGAVRIATNDIAATLNGAAVTTDTSATNPATPTTLRIGIDQSGGNQLFGYIRRLAIFARALPNAELQAITL